MIDESDGTGPSGQTGCHAEVVRCAGARTTAVGEREDLDVSVDLECHGIYVMNADGTNVRPRRLARCRQPAAYALYPDGPLRRDVLLQAALTEKAFSC
jgi:hypothetical protein